MSPTLAMRPMHHPPAFETIPELAPVLEYQYYTSSGSGANTSSNCNNSVSFSASPSSLHSRNTARKHSSAVPTTVTAPSQLPPLDTALPLAYPMYPGLQTASNTITTTSTTGMSNTNTTTAITAAGSTAGPPTTNIMSRRGQEPRSLNRPRKISTSYSRRDDSPFPPKCPSYETSQQYRIQYQSPTSSSPPLSILPRPPQQQQQQQRKKKQKSPPEQPNALFGTLPGEVLQVVLEWLQSVHLDSSTSTSCATCWARDLCSLCLASRKWSEVARLALYQDIRIVGDDSAAHRKRFKLAQGCRMTLLRRTLRANSHLAAVVRLLQLPMPVGDSCDATPSSSSRAAGGLSPKQVYENRVASLVMACPNLEVLVGPGATHDHDTFNRITHALSTRTNLKTMNWRIGASSGSGNDLVARPGSASHRESSSVFSSALACMLLPPPPLNAAQEASFLGHHRQWHSLASLSVHCLPGASLAPDTLLQRALTCLPSLQHLHLSRVPGNAFGDAALLSLPALRSLTLAHLPGVTAGGLSAFATRPNSQPLRSLQLRHTPLTSLPALARLLSHLPSLVSFALVQEFAPLMPTADDGDDAFALWMMPYLASRTLVRLHWDIVAPTHGTDLRAARMAAQARLDDARPRFRFQVQVHSDEGQLVDDFGLGGYVGTVGSPIHYSLDPDWGSSDARGGLVDVSDLTGPGGGGGGDDEEEGEGGYGNSGGVSGCTGSWNWREGVVADKREKETWWHTERARWVRPRLD
ncbi:hypothetical protein HC256_002559 [Beauveria bassiana]|nr:hypothetical protein HC256_002559 [Beauveria bassiana]